MWNLSWPAQTSSRGTRPEWRRRRLLLNLTLLWGAITASWIIFFGPDDVLRQTALVGIFGLEGSLLLGYFGFATKDDANYLKFLSVTGNRDPPRPSPTPIGVDLPDPDAAQP